LSSTAPSFARTPAVYSAAGRLCVGRIARRLGEQVNDAASASAGLLLPALPRQLDGVMFVAVAVERLVREQPDVLPEQVTQTPAANAKRVLPDRTAATAPGAYFAGRHYGHDVARVPRGAPAV